MSPEAQQPVVPRLDPTGVQQRGPEATVEHLRDGARTGVAHPKRFRVAQLDALERMLRERRADFLDALYADLGKGEAESHATELQIVEKEIEHARRHLDDWMRTRTVPTPLVMAPSSGQITPRPLGLVLIVAPWNYPVNLTLTPLVDAIAAGNTVVLKPSEQAPATAALLERLIPEYLDHRSVGVVNGGAGATTRLLAKKFDHILYTGGERVGRIVYEAAAKQLTPVTLELGGKSPAVVLDGDVKVIARRLAYGKFMNAGQTCVAPDYVLAVRDMAPKLLATLRKVIREFYGENPQASPDYGRIVSDQHLERLAGLLGEGTLVTGGQVDAAQRYIAPTVLADVPADAPVMQEEIFGPILPVLRVETFDDALAFIAARPHPLAAYLFSERGGAHKHFEENVQAGAIGIGAANLHLAVPELPFGGVGASGIGAYHGSTGFDTFSQQRPTFTKSTRLDTLKAVYPPYGSAKTAMLRRML